VCDSDSDSRDYDDNPSESDSRMIRDVIAAGRRYGIRGGQRCPHYRLDSQTRLISRYIEVNNKSPDRSEDRNADRSEDRSHDRSVVLARRQRYLY
jgi:hypothetical protein